MFMVYHDHSSKICYDASGLSENLSIQELGRKISAFEITFDFLPNHTECCRLSIFSFKISVYEFYFFDLIVLPTFAKLITVTKLTNLLTSSA